LGKQQSISGSEIICRCGRVSEHEHFLFFFSAAGFSSFSSGHLLAPVLHGSRSPCSPVFLIIFLCAGLVPSGSACGEVLMKGDARILAARPTFGHLETTTFAPLCGPMLRGPKTTAAVALGRRTWQGHRYSSPLERAIGRGLSSDRATRRGNGFASN